jgi:hypothetical protein
MKGQAAVEYLMTYGWAILALLIVLAALFSSGVLTPSYLVSDECAFGTNLKCDATLYNDGGSTQMIFNVFNGFPYKVKVNSISIETAEGDRSFTGFGGNTEIKSGANTTFTGTLGGPALADGTVRRFVGNITYVSCAPELGPNCTTTEHMVSGRVTSRVIPQ